MVQTVVLKEVGICLLLPYLLKRQQAGLLNDDLCSVARTTGESSVAMKTTIQDPPRQRLVAERMHRRWTQLEVADQMGTTPGNVSRWERGITAPGPYFRRKLCELFGKSAKELDLAREESFDAASLHTQNSPLTTSFQGDRSPVSNPFFIGSEDLMAQVHALLRLERTAALSDVSANSRQRELNSSKQESLDQELFMQAVTQWLQTQILENVGAVVLVVLNGNLRTRPSSPNQRPRDRHTRSGGDCCDEYPSMYKTLRQRQGA
jgi:transcriptional regulator with XRE-family HTH domain